MRHLCCSIVRRLMNVYISEAKGNLTADKDGISRYDYPCSNSAEDLCITEFSGGG